MSETSNHIWLGIEPSDLRDFERAVKRVDETNIFPLILADDKFIKIDESTYAKGNDQLIKIFYQEGKWRYQNLKNSKDFGSAIQFIANRWSTGSPQIEKSPAIIIHSSKVANVYYQSQIKRLKSEHKINLLLNPQAKKPQRMKRHIYAILECRGDFKEAAKRLIAEGYGTAYKDRK